MSTKPFNSHRSPTDAAKLPARVIHFGGMKDFNLLKLHNSAGLIAQLLPNGTLFALRHDETLINQVLPGPAENGLFRLLIRWRNGGNKRAPSGSRKNASWASLVGPGLNFGCDGKQAVWQTVPQDSQLYCTTLFGLHPKKAGWGWRIQVHNSGAVAKHVEVFHAQDLGLADEGAVRNNEAYVSQYIDLLPLQDETLGWTILARQNQPMKEQRYPWAAFACENGAAAFCTDARQFFGSDHRLTGEPSAMGQTVLPSRRLQEESALAGLQNQWLEVPPGETVEVTFVAAYLPDHPGASVAGDLVELHQLLPATWLHFAGRPPMQEFPASVFIADAWLNGRRLNDKEWRTWFPGERRHEERDRDDSLLSFFQGGETHVVTGEKETLVARPHGHILRSGEPRWIDERQFGVTCYAAGIFGAQAYLGNPSFARLLGVVRNQLGLTRASGQRVFVRRDGRWLQLGVPSAFAMETGLVRWIYKLKGNLIEARVWCSGESSASFLELNVLHGPPCEFLVSHQLVLGSNEFDVGGEVAIHIDGWVGCHPVADGFLASHLPETCFAIAAAHPDQLAGFGHDSLLYADGAARRGPYVAFATKSVSTCGIIMLGVTNGKAALAGAVADARAIFAAGRKSKTLAAIPVRLSGSHDPGVARLNEVLPWFTHNAGIHFSAPHGLEQSGGAAWGVRDVCQGSVEWLLAAGEFATIRRILEVVFAQQYAPDGTWPQWFMFPPFKFCQQAHSHGDVCFWPLKALCDYVEASNDFAFLSQPIGYTDPEKFGSIGPVENVWSHCDRVIAHCESRFMPGTALVNYGDGDWDDTLQPANPAMRTSMISAWTVGLSFHVFRQLGVISRRAGEEDRAKRLDSILARMRKDFAARLMPDGIVAGFVVKESNGRVRALLHPTDKVTGIRYRLLPMTRSVLAEIFTAGEATRHLALVESYLSYPDGVRLMSEPAVYHAGLQLLFKRADSAANVGREIGLQYVHAHLRYAEALAKVGDADKLWRALAVVNPVALATVVRNALPRQSNVYFSSSDADFSDRYEATARWSELHSGKVGVRGGWRLYSSGPGLFLHKVRACLLGLRESFDEVIFDPVLPRSLDGLVADTTLLTQPVKIIYHVREGSFAPRSITVNGMKIDDARRETNPYRTGGLCVPTKTLRALFSAGQNLIEIEL